MDLVTKGCLPQDVLDTLAEEGAPAPIRPGDEKILSGGALETANYWGSVIINGTLNVSGLMIAPLIGFFLSKNRRFKNPLAAAMISLATLLS